MPRQEAILSIPFPLAGVDVSKAFVRQPMGAPGPYGVMATTPVAHNVRAVEVATDRVRGASRPGLLRWLSQVVDFTLPTLAPDEITGLQAWYDASDIANLWQDSGRTTPVASDGDPIGAWDDLSGNGRHLTQATAGKRATYKENIQNSLSIARFDGSDDKLSTSTFSVSQPNTTFVVCKVDAAGTKRAVASARLSAAAAQHLYADSTSRWMYSAGTDRFTTITVDTSFHLLIAVFNGANSSRMEVDGVVGTVDSPGTGATDGLTVGSNFQENEHWDGDVGEAGMYNRALTESETYQLSNYLVNKWGL